MLLDAIETNATIGTAEYSMGLASTSGAPTALTTHADCDLVVDMAAMLAGDEFLIQVYEKAVSGGTQRVCQRFTLKDTGLVEALPLGLLKNGYDVTIKKIAGTDRAIPMSLRRRLSAPTAAQNATAVADLETAGLTPWSDVVSGLEEFMLYRSGVSTYDIAPAGSTSTTIKFSAGASAVNDFYVGQVVLITAGTGRGQCRQITGYVGATNVATVSPAWATTPDGTSWYSVHQSGVRLTYELLDSEMPALTAAVAALPSTGTVTALISPLATSVALAAVQADTDDIQTRLARVAGLLNENARIDNTTYTSTKMTSARLRIFASAAALAASVDGAANGADSEVYRYTITVTYTGDEIDSYRVSRDL